MKFSDIEEAFTFVNCAPYGDHMALVCPDGRILYRAEMADIDDISDEDLDDENLLEIPGKKELDLGQRLVFRFVESRSPALYQHVRDIFSGRGAYARFKDLLDSEGLLQNWYDFENSEQEKALRQWCQDNGIQLDD